MALLSDWRVAGAHVCRSGPGQPALWPASESRRWGPQLECHRSRGWWGGQRRRRRRRRRSAPSWSVLRIDGIGCAVCRVLGASLTASRRRRCGTTRPDGRPLVVPWAGGVCTPGGALRFGRRHRLSHVWQRACRGRVARDWRNDAGRYKPRGWRGRSDRRRARGARPSSSQPSTLNDRNGRVSQSVKERASE